MAADLHVHTNCSDSTLSPQDVINECERQRVNIVAITDHDAVDGVPVATKAAAGRRVRVIPGVEMTAYVEKTEVHVVGLFIDIEEPQLREVLRLTREERHLRIHKIIEKLSKINVRITPEQVMKYAKDGAPGRPHVAQALVEHGYASNIGDAFQKYIGSSAPAYIQKYELSPAEAAEAIHKAGGVAIIAHPGAGLADTLVREMLTQGLDGLEAYHPMHDNGQVQHYMDLAHKSQALVSGGSDCHGDVKEGVHIGGVTIDDEFVARIEKRSAEIRAAKTT